MTSAEALLQLGENLERAHSHLESVYDQLGAEYQSDAAKQYELQLEDQTDPSRTYDSWWVKNDRENIWHPTIGGKLPNDGANWSWVITGYVESVQPKVVQAAELLPETRDVTDDLTVTSRNDLELLASIPTALGQSMEVLVAASESMENAANKIGEMRNALNESKWEGDGRDAYFDSLTPQEEAFKECQGYVEATAEASTALADLTVDVFQGFLGVRQKQLNWIQNLSATIFSLVNPGSWWDVAEKLHNRMTVIRKNHEAEYSESLEEMAESAHNQHLLESAERTASMTWPAPFSGIDGTWSDSADA